MANRESRRHNRLNQRQIELLYALYRFRFGTTDLLAELFGKKSGVILYSRLKLLVEQKYVGRNFDSSYRIQGKHASYYLLPKAFKALSAYQEGQKDKSSPFKVETHPRVFKRIYKDKEASEQFINHSFEVLKIHNLLQKRYGDALKFFTKSDLSVDAYQQYFPRALPDGFLSYKVGEEYRRFFLDVFEPGAPFFLTLKRIKQHIDYFESAKWSVTKSHFPTIVMVCQIEADQKKLERRIAKNLENNGIDNMNFKVVTKEALLSEFDMMLAAAPKS